METKSLLWNMFVMMMAGMMSISLVSCGDGDSSGDGDDDTGDVLEMDLPSMYTISAYWKLDNHTSSQSLGVTKGETYYIRAEGSDDGMMMDSNMNTVATLE